MRAVERLRARDWEVSAILRYFEEREWVDAFDFAGKRRHYNAILRYVHEIEATDHVPHKGMINPFTERRFRLTPQMIADARAWLDAQKPVEDLPRRFYERGWLALGEVHYCWLRLSRLDERASDEIADAVDAVDRLAGRSTRQGWRVSAEERRALERYSVERATRHYRRLGFEVADVGAKESWDLECVKGQIELRVEVKGTTGDGSGVLLTRGEVDHARRRRKNLALFIVTNVTLKQRGSRVTCSGGKIRETRPWAIDRDGALEPIGYLYSLVAAD